MRNALLWTALVILLSLIITTQGLQLKDVVGKNFASRATSGLVALYTFEETEGDFTVDTSSQVENLNINPSVVSWLYDSPDDRSTGIQISSNPLWPVQSANVPSQIAININNTDRFTIEMWIDPQVDGARLSPVPLVTFSKNQDCTTGGIATDYYFYFGSWRTDINIKGCAGAQSTAPPAWDFHSGIQHHAMTFSSGNGMNYYVDGKKQDSTNGELCPSNILMDSDAILTFGRYAESSFTPFTGKLYMLAIFSLSFTQSTIQNLYNAGLPNQPPTSFPVQVITQEDMLVVFSLNATDPEEKLLQFNITTLPVSGRLEDPSTNFPVTAFSVITSANIRYVPDLNFNGMDSFKFFAIEAEGAKKKNSRVATVTIEVTPMPDEPVTFNQSVSISDADVEMVMNVTGFHPDEETEIIEGRLVSVEWASNSTNPNPPGRLVQTDDTVITAFPATIVDGPPSFQFKFTPGWVQRNEFDVAQIRAKLCDNVTCSSIPGIISVQVWNTLQGEWSEITVEEDTPTNITLNVMDQFENRPFSRICWNFTVHTKSGTFDPAPPTSVDKLICTNKTQLQLLYTPDLNVEGPNIEQIDFEARVEHDDLSGPAWIAISTPGHAVVNVDPVSDQPEYRTLNFSVVDFEPTLLNFSLWHVDDADKNKPMKLRVLNVSGPGTVRRLEDGVEFPLFSNTSHTTLEFVPVFLNDKTVDVTEIEVQFVLNDTLESNRGPAFVHSSQSLFAISQLDLNGMEDEELEFELRVQDDGASSLLARGTQVEHVFNITKQPPPPNSGSVTLNSTNTQQATLMPFPDFWGLIEFEFVVERWNVTALPKQQIGRSLPAVVRINVRGTHDPPDIDLSEIPDDPSVEINQYLHMRIRVNDADVGWPLIVQLSTDPGLGFINVSLPNNVSLEFSTGSPDVPAIAIAFTAPLELVNAILHDNGISFRGVQVANCSLRMTIEDGPAPTSASSGSKRAASAFSVSKTIYISINPAPQSSSKEPESPNYVALFFLGIGVPTLLLLLLILLLIGTIVAVILILVLKKVFGHKTVELPPDFAKVAFVEIPKLGKLDQWSIRRQAKELVQFEEALVSEAHRFMFARAVLLNIHGDKLDVAVRQLVIITEYKRRTLQLLRALIVAEVDQATSKEVLFRANSVASKALKKYAVIMGLPYLYDTLRPPLKAVPTAATGLQVNRVNQEENLVLNQTIWELLATGQGVLKAILSSVDACPMQIRYLCREVDAAVKAKFGDNCRHIAIGGFFFLRFVCPAVASPQEFALLSNEDVLQKSGRFVAVAKLLMNLASGVKFGDKEPNMARLNLFIEENEASLAQFYDKIVQLPENVTPESLPDVKLPTGLHETSLIALHNAVCERENDIKSWLTSDATKKTFPNDTAALAETLNNFERLMNNSPGTTTNAGAANTGAASSNTVELVEVHTQV